MTTDETELRGKEISTRLSGVSDGVFILRPLMTFSFAYYTP